MKVNGFKLQFMPGEIRVLAARYAYEDDGEALKAGRHIVAGDYTRANLEAIFRWKRGGRGISRLRRNSDADIHDALRLAAGAQTVLLRPICEARSSVLEYPNKPFGLHLQLQ